MGSWTTALAAVWAIAALTLLGLLAWAHADKLKRLPGPQPPATPSAIGQNNVQDPSTTRSNQMNTTEPIVVGRDRYRLHPARRGDKYGYEVEWQRDYQKERREVIRTETGGTLEYRALPPWESTSQLFLDERAAVRFVLNVLESSRCRERPRRGWKSKKPSAARRTAERRRS